MAEPDEVARSHYRRQQAIVRRILTLMRELGRELRPEDLAGSFFGGVDTQVYAALVEAQRQAAQQGDEYIAATLLAAGVAPDPGGSLLPDSLAGVASDGRPLQSLLAWPIIRHTRATPGDGASQLDVMGQAWRELMMIVGTQVADAGRVASGVRMATEPAVIGYERVVQLPACSRCIVLAGRLYTWSTGFARHPNCDCVHKPIGSIAEWQGARPGNFPDRIFERMSPEQQDKVFGRAGAKAIRDGADIAQVVNARRGVYTAGGHIYTREGTTARGLAGRRLGQLAKEAGSRYRRSQIPRVMPEDVYKAAGDDRAEVIRLLRRFGFIT